MSIADLPCAPSFVERLRTLAEAPTRLMQDAAARLDELPLSRLRSHGFFKDPIGYSYVYQYPPPAILEPLLPEAVWRGAADSSIADSVRTTGLYVHIPFCTGTCAYCYFARYAKQDSPISIDAYVALLRKEVALIAAQPNTAGARITTLALGGGTPTCLSEAQLIGLFSCLQQCFDLGETAEISVEASPETIIGDKTSVLHVLRQYNVNRLSIGVESFDDVLLKQLGRRHDSSMAESAVLASRAAGFTNINLDLMYGLPGQTITQWEHTLSSAIRLRPQSLSVYRLRIHPRGALAKTVIPACPDEQATTLMYIMAVESCRNSGYLHAASHTFVLSEQYIQQHVTEKQGLKEHELVGIGQSAYSFVNRHSYWNECSLELYAQQIRAGRLPVWRGERLTVDEVMRKAIVLGLHEYPGINISSFQSRFHCSPLQIFGPALRPLLDLGLVIINNGHISLTYTGLLFADEICPHFYSELVRQRIRAKGLHSHGMGFMGDSTLQLV
jgi:oxygen-independent coproporphyrinogen-3 oxidase